MSTASRPCAACVRISGSSPPPTILPVPTERVTQSSSDQDPYMSGAPLVDLLRLGLALGQRTAQVRSGPLEHSSHHPYNMAAITSSPPQYGRYDQGQWSTTRPINLKAGDVVQVTVRASGALEMSCNGDVIPHHPIIIPYLSHHPISILSSAHPSHHRPLIIPSSSPHHPIITPSSPHHHPVFIPSSSHHHHPIYGR